MAPGVATRIVRLLVLRGTMAPLHLGPTLRLRLTDIEVGQKTVTIGTVIMMEMGGENLFT